MLASRVRSSLRFPATQRRLATFSSLDEQSSATSLVGLAIHPPGNQKSSTNLWRGTLAVNEVSFSYSKGAEELFGGLDYSFRAGAITAITGPSGRGKSTLLYVLGLMLTPTAGQVLLDDAPVSALPDWGRSRLRATRIGFVFQDAALDPSRTILDSVMEPALYAGSTPAEVAGRALGLLDQLGVASRADHRPGEISGGQAQRVAVCRALITNPDVILADEPTGNLDRANASEVLSALSAATGNERTVVIATHDPSVIELADEVLTL